MKRLLLLRHAKSDWSRPGQDDFDRPINRRGLRAARAMGGEMKRTGDDFSFVIASPARRVVETLNELAQGRGEAIEPRFDQRLYLGSAGTLLDVVRGADGSAASLLVVGHNPGLERLALLLSSDEGPLRARLADTFPTAALATIELDVDDWAKVAPGSGRLVRFLRPSDLDSRLGPDN